VDLTLPITLENRLVTDVGTWGWFEIVGRLRSEVTVERATAETDAILQSFLADHPGSSNLRRSDRMTLPTAAKGMDVLRSRFSTPLYSLMAAALLVLLIACVNLAGLMLVRAAARRREFAIRLATGAQPGRLYRQVLTETVVLFLVGAGAGLLVADVMIEGLSGFFAIGRNPIVLDIPFDWRRAVFTAGVTLVAAVATSAWPAMRAVRSDPHTAIKAGDGRLVGSRPFSMASRAMVVSQVALALVLSVSALVFVKTILNLRRVDLGFRADRVLTVSLTPEFSSEAAPEARRQLWARVLERVRGLPGIRSASLSVLTPLSGRDTGRAVTVRGFEPANERDQIVRVNHVSEDYFSTFGIDVLAGRGFDSRDVTGAQNVAVVNEAAIRFYFGGRMPIGESLRFGDSGVYEVVGVVRDHRHRSVRDEAPPFAFVPLWQPLDPLSRLTLAVSSDVPFLETARAITQETWAVHAKTLVSDVVDVDEQIDATLISERLLSTLATSFAVLAIGLAGIGLYGVLSYSVARRRSEIGIRMALGASGPSIARRIAAEVLLQGSLGIAIGIPAAWATAQATRRLLFDVTPTDPSNYLLGVLVLAVAACLAAYVPARRAACVDPMVALRCE
jgi:predicted permease